MKTVPSPESSLPSHPFLHIPVAKTLLPLWLAIAASLNTAHAAPEDHEVLAQRFLETYSLEDAKPADLPLSTLLEGRFLTARAGLIDVRIPMHALEDKDLAKQTVALVKATLRMQATWLEWMGESAIGGDKMIADFETLESEFKRYKSDKLVSAAKAGKENDFFTIVGISDENRVILDRVSKWMGKGAPLQLGRDEESAPLVLFPERKEFVEFIAYVGWSDDYKRPYYWVDGTSVWNECFVDNARAACLEFPAVGGGDYTDGMPMNQKNPLEMEQQITQLAAMALYESYYGSRLPGALVGGLANNIVIDIYGEVDTRLDGSLKSNQTNARSVFIPGGRSEGGLLPENSAKNRWRDDAGKDYFIRVLRKAQKAGKSHNKSTKHKYKSFLLVNAAGSQRHVTTAPVFGSVAADRATPPDSVADDYSEFLRAYKSGFLYWLQTQAAGKKESRAKFGEFLVTLAQGTPKDFESAIEEFYGAPLSSKEVDKNDLEGRFLKFVSK